MKHILRCHDITKTDFVRAQGCHLFDSQGRAYLDFEAGIWCAALGHNHPRINQAIHQQIEQVTHLGTRYPNEQVEIAAEAVLATLDLPDGKCVFLSSGSEAVEFAVQAARRLSDRPLLLTLSDSFLGSYGSAGKKASHEWYGLDWQACAACARAETCDPQCACLAGIPFEQIGGFVLEPGSASGWVRFPPRGLVRALAGRVQAAGGLVVINEITTGVGRTGAWYGFQHYDLRPDLVAIGKGLGNGYPVSCAAMSAEVARRLEESGFRYAQSHQNDPLGCAVAQAVIEVMHEEDLVARSRQVGAYLLAGLQQILKERVAIKEARGRGLMVAFELETGRAGAQGLSASAIYQAMLERGFLVGISSKSDAGFVRFDPPLVVSEREVDLMLENLGEVINCA